MTAEAQVAHSTRKLNNALKTKGEVVKDAQNKQIRVDSLQAELQKVKKSADVAQGASFFQDLIVG